MAMKTFVVDDHTRLQMGDTAWCDQVLVSLLRKGHKIQLSEVNSYKEPLVRDAAEMARVDALLNEAGIPII